MTDRHIPGVTAQLDALMAEYYGPAAAADIADDVGIWSDTPFNAHAQPSCLLKGQRDSLDKIDFMARCEDEFRVVISDDIVAEIGTKAQLREALIKLVAAREFGYRTGIGG